ncbi:MAG: choice-of-anchor J domain-containing protein [Candidatus Zixiibacteriota bacterium]|nr:MAG: choice-of-anchor J domain-containing protein [candidate division Zixibacteria bacterium]
MTKATGNSNMQEEVASGRISPPGVTGEDDWTPIITEGFEDYIPGDPEGIPAGWAVYDNDGNSYEWEEYDVNPYEGAYHLRVHWHAGDYCDDWLVTPLLHVPPQGDALEFYARAYNAYYQEDWEVYICATGNAVNDFLTAGTMIGSDGTSSTTYSLYSYPIPAGYHDTNAWIAIRCISYDAFYLYLDALSMPNLGLFEGFEGTPSSGFPPAGWTHQVVSGTDPDNEWDVSYGTSTHPSGVIPHGGSFMAQYDAYFISAGNRARLYTSPMNFAAHGGEFRLRFWMNHDTGYSNSDDRIEIQVSLDGSSWTTVDTFSRYDGTTGWVENTVDLSAYAAEPSVYLDFLGISEYGNSIYVDDIVVVQRSTYICGDADNDGVINILDVTFIVNYLYKDGPAPDHEEACDADGNDIINILDVTHLVNYLYKDGPEPIC